MKKKRSFHANEFLRSSSRIDDERLFFIFGEDQYLQDMVLRRLKKKFLQSGAEDFDLVVLHGDETRGDDVLEALEQLPFLSSLRIVILRDAGKLRSSDTDRIIPYLENPSDTTVFIVTAGKVDRRKGFYKKLGQTAVGIECKKPKYPADIANWLRFVAKEKHIVIDPATIEFFANAVELDYLVAASEFEKLILYTGNDKRLHLRDAERSPLHTRANNIYDLHNALGERNLRRALEILTSLQENQEQLVFLIVVLTGFFSSLWKIDFCKRKGISKAEIVQDHLGELFPFLRQRYVQYSSNYNQKSLDDVFQTLYETDLDLKTLGVSEKVLGIALICKICQAAK